MSLSAEMLLSKLDHQLQSNELVTVYLVSKIFDRSVATAGTPDIVKMSHAVIHWQQNIGFLQCNPTWHNSAM